MRKYFLLLLAVLLLGGTASPALAQKSVHVACVGDSITFGANLTDRDKNSYPAVLGNWMGAGYEVRNFGVSGTTLLVRGNAPYINRSAYTNALAFVPDIVVIMLGTNDSKHRGDGSLGSDQAPDNWQYKADYIPDYEKLITSFRKANPAVKMYVCLPTPCFPGRWGINNRTIHDEIIPMVRQVADDTGATVIDLNTPLAEKSNLFPDTVHPNNQGALAMASIIYQALTGKAAPVATL